MKALLAAALVCLIGLCGCGTAGNRPAAPATVTVTAPPPQAQTPTPTPEPTPAPTSQPSTPPSRASSSDSEQSSDEPAPQRTQKPHVYDSLFDGCPDTIKKGQSGRCVTIVQMRLNVYGFYVVEDGDFGNQTDTAVRSFQSSRGITVDGQVGTQTKTYLGG